MGKKRRVAATDTESIEWLRRMALDEQAEQVLHDSPLNADDAGSGLSTILSPSPSKGIRAPEPNIDTAEDAAHWVYCVDDMLQDLTDALNGLLALCDDYPVDGLSLTQHIRPEFLDEQNFVCNVELIIVDWTLGWREYSLRLRNAIEKTPFQSETIRALRSCLSAGHEKQFRAAVSAYKEQLQFLSDWAYAKKHVRSLRNGTKKTGDKVNNDRNQKIEDVIRTLSARHSGQIPTRDAVRTELKSKGIRISDTDLGKILNAFRRDGRSVRSTPAPANEPH